MADETRQPGHPSAREAGCTCPSDQTGPRYEADKDCPLHGLHMLAAELGVELSAPQRGTDS